MLLQRFQVCTPTLALPALFSPTVSVSPKDSTIVVGGEHHSPTGREPWRCPTLNIHEPTGNLNYQLYDWGGPSVGMDGLHLVSDSAVRLVTVGREHGCFWELHLEGVYTFWDYLHGALRRNDGIRIDHLFHNPKIANQLATRPHRPRGPQLGAR